MAERSQLQYTPLVGPVWSEPVAEKLAWLPSVQQPGRGLPPNRLGDFVRPEFEALYKPAQLEWTPRGQQPARNLPPNRLGDFVRPEFQALYKSERLEWIPSDRYAGRTLARSAYDYSVLVQLVSAPAYDPQTLEWLARATYPQVPVERRILGDFQQPGFDALFKPEQLQWFPSDRYAGRSAARALNDWTVLVQLVTVPFYDPQNLEWQPSDRYAGRSLARALVDWSVLQGEPIVAPTPPVVIAEVPTPAGRPSRRRHYIMPDGTRLEATTQEAFEWLRQYSTPVQPEPSGPPHSTAERSIPMPQIVLTKRDVKFIPAEDAAPDTWKAVINERFIYAPPPEVTRQAQEIANRMRANEDAIIALLLWH